MNLHIPEHPLSLQVQADWPQFARHCPALPSDFDHSDRVAVGSWISGLKPIETSDIHLIQDAIRDQLFRNGGQYQGSRQILAIDGDSALGKTVAVSTAMLRIHDEILNSPSPAKPGVHVRHFPVVYVSDQGASFPRLLRAIAGFVHSPLGARKAVADDLLEHLARYLPSVGTRLIVIDDAHMLRRVGAARDLTDDLKRTVDRLPVSFVFVGAGLQRSALFKTSNTSDEYSAATQLQRRIRLIEMVPLSAPEHRKAWTNRINRFTTEIEKIPGYDWSILRNPTFRQNLFALSHGSTGLSFELAKDTLTQSIRQDRIATVDSLITAARSRGQRC